MTGLGKGQGTGLPLSSLDDLESSLKRAFRKLSLPARPASMPGLLVLALLVDFMCSLPPLPC